MYLLVYLHNNGLYCHNNLKLKSKDELKDEFSSLHTWFYYYHYNVL